MITNIRFAIAVGLSALVLMMGKVTTYANASTLIEFTIDSNTEIFGLTSATDLGEKTGTLEEFARQAIDENTIDYLVFPANFFNAYDDSKEVFGGIYSHGEIKNDSWLDYGCGFDANGKFHLFRYGYTVSGTLRDDKLIITDKESVEIITAFNCYPWLIKDGEPLSIEPTPAADEKYLNAKALRAFMGQTSDGTFYYGILNSATIFELQEYCVSLGLVNAVNTDGGASAGAYRDGKYVAVPGRDLASAVLIIQSDKAYEPETKDIQFDEEALTNEKASGALIEISVKLNGELILFPDQQPILLDGYAFIPTGEFNKSLSASTDWNGYTRVLTLTKGETIIEMQMDEKTAKLNGVELTLDAAPMIMNDRAMLPARFIVETLDAEASWNPDTKTFSVITSKLIP